MHYYMFGEDEDRIRIVISSEDDVCATIAIQNYEVRFFIRDKWQMSKRHLWSRRGFNPLSPQIEPN